MEFIANIVKNAFFLLLLTRIAVVVVLVILGYRLFTAPGVITAIKRFWGRIEQQF